MLLGALPTLDRTRYASSGGGAHGVFMLADAADGQPDILLLAESLNAEYRDNVLPHTPAAVAECVNDFETLTMRI
jgi:hypothetical protein